MVEGRKLNGQPRRLAKPIVAFDDTAVVEDVGEEWQSDGEEEVVYAQHGFSFTPQPNQHPRYSRHILLRLCLWPIYISIEAINVFCYLGSTRGDK